MINNFVCSSILKHAKCVFLEANLPSYDIIYIPNFPFK